ncbi:inositol monophosphatase family protein [Sphingomonas nostoxanthinifaciens]|uniref:inositol monophosphatase family protein n=1 Tax=Sphingomonas nostoxanthinifaciens TaxID=2872652 RepID=UPI001CC1E03F|nr:inositol monophosphatase family protein [Sphingomonas nostoxanthinifaciens]UAK25181.1 inositol monophosphatase [Sphingomonas nostoxanthinifaciens]
MHKLDAPVSALIRDVAQRIVMPRFRMLDPGQIEEKAPDELVTIADTESEAALTEALLRLLPGSRVVGEEACAADESLMGTIGAGEVWIVDPIDGTHNFAHGQPPFGIMIALAADGVTQAGWIFDPIAGRMCHAARGQGFFVDGAPIRSRPTGQVPPIAGLSTKYLPDDFRADVEARAEGKLACVPIPRCAAEQYPRLILGVNDVALFWRTFPWDHAPGALMVEEAGGRVARLDGTPYAPSQDGKGLLVAATPDLWDAAAAILLG